MIDFADLWWSLTFYKSRTESRASSTAQLGSAYAWCAGSAPWGISLIRGCRVLLAGSEIAHTYRIMNKFNRCGGLRHCFHLGNHWLKRLQSSNSCLSCAWEPGFLDAKCISNSSCIISVSFNPSRSLETHRGYGRDNLIGSPFSGCWRIVGASLHPDHI